MSSTTESRPGARAEWELVAERPTAQVVDGLIVLGGLYVALSPWILDFSGDAALTRNNLVIGAVIALLGLGFGWAYERTHGTAWLCPALGLWTLLVPWLVQGTPSTTTWVSNVVAGLAVVVLGLAVMTIVRPGRRAAIAR